MGCSIKSGVCDRWIQPAWRICCAIRDKGGLLACLNLAFRKYKEGLSIKTILRQTWQSGTGTEYAEWQDRLEKLTQQDICAIKKQIQGLQSPPLISILMPVYNPNPRLLRETLDSVLSQIYPHWELCIADDASPNAQIQTILEDYSRKDSRIRVHFRKENGNICAASNSALNLCTGIYTVLMDHDDILPELALYFVVMEVLRHPDAMMIYSDEDLLSPQGKRYRPCFKPDWNEPLFLASNYLNHLSVYRTSLLREIGGFRPGYEGSQDHDLALRCILKIRSCQIRHIPRVLYHWRQFYGSGSFSDKALERCEKARRQAAADYLANRGYEATVTRGRYGFNSINYTLKKLPLVTCVIPVRNHAELTQVCLDALLNHTDYAPIEIILVDTGSAEQGTLSLCKVFQNNPKVHVVHWDKPFNQSEIYNMAARKAHGEILALLNRPIKVIHSDWLRRLVSYAIQPETGAVGAKLLYTDGTIQHAGLVLDSKSIVVPVGQKLPRDTTEFFYQFQLPRWCSAVTGDCLIVRKELFFQFGGFDEIALKVAFNDVDFCLKLHEGGYHNTYVGDVELYQLESEPRGYGDTPEEKAKFQQERSTMQERWGEQLLWDPFYPAHYSRASSLPSMLKINEKYYLSQCDTWKPWEESEKYK